MAITLAGCAFGGLAIAFDPEAKPVLMPFSHLMQDPRQRVAEEENATGDRLEGHKTSFSAELMTHNTQVSIFTLALGMTWGVGSIIMLFYNGVILGAVAVDYVRAGETKFLLGWLMPHGVSGNSGHTHCRPGRADAGLCADWPWPARNAKNAPAGDFRRCFDPHLWRRLDAYLGRLHRRRSFRSIHEPVIPYSVKIAFGCVELVLLFLFLAKSGTDKKPGA